jgi:hypothetical protein
MRINFEWIDVASTRSLIALSSYPPSRIRGMISLLPLMLLSYAAHALMLSIRPVGSLDTSTRCSLRHHSYPATN